MGSRLGYFRRERIARKPHQCYNCGRHIGTGAPYASVTAMPRYDFNPRPGQWTRAPFCLDCSRGES